MNPSDWISIVTSIVMVIITSIYVYATIRIQKANEKAVNASKEQLAESKRQFNETRRLDIMPYLQFEREDGIQSNYSMNLVLFGSNLKGHYRFRVILKNIGKGTAKDIHYFWNNFEGHYPRQFPICALQNGDRTSIDISFAYELKPFEQTVATFEMMYKDLLENEYSQLIEFEFGYDSQRQSTTMVGMRTNPPCMRIRNIE